MRFLIACSSIRLKSVRIRIELNPGSYSYLHSKWTNAVCSNSGIRRIESNNSRFVRSTTSQLPIDCITTTFSTCNQPATVTVVGSGYETTSADGYVSVVN